jgi:hypothetical protein
LGRKVKCRSCLRMDEKSTMILEEGKLYFHQGDCHEEYLRHKEFKRIEAEKWDQLYKYLLQLHSAVIIPVANVVRLQALRNGEDIVAGKRVKKYKQGVPYELMLEAYKLAEDSIRWCIKNKLNGSNDVKAINYCISIMIGKLNEAWVRQQNRKRQEEQQRKIQEQTTYADMSIENKNNTYKKKDELDISDLI